MSKKTGIASHPFGLQEGIDLEFKEAAHDLPKNLFETVCAFLNMDGGLIVLGVADDGSISGVENTEVERLKSEIANLSNNPNKLTPPHLLFPHALELNGRWVITIQVPTSHPTSQGTSYGTSHPTSHGTSYGSSHGIGPEVT